jgi:hypothetical protein
MKTNPCDNYLKELAAAAITFRNTETNRAATVRERPPGTAENSPSLSPEAAAHLQQCEVCQTKLRDLQNVAAMHTHAAANLPEPQLRLRRRQLERALKNGQPPRTSFAIPLRPAIAAAIAVITIVTFIFTSRTRHEPPATQVIVENNPGTNEDREETLQPTLHALRHEVQHGREQILAAAPSGVALRHYRVKDVENELRN